MTRATTTTSLASAATAGTGWLSAVRRALAPVRVPGLRQSMPEGVAELLARADAYEATQPSFAADLRAGARRMLEAR